MCSLLSNAQSKVWINSSDNSNLGFTIKHLAITKVKGHFEDYNIKVTTTNADYTDAEVRLTAKAASINTNSSSRDKLLREKNFFDTDNYPLLVFKSTSANNINTKKGFMSGDLTMHGITKPITLTVKYLGLVINPINKKETISFKVTGTVKRSDYTIGPKHSGAILSNKVKIVATVEFIPYE